MEVANASTGTVSATSSCDPLTSSTEPLRVECLGCRQVLLWWELEELDGYCASCGIGVLDDKDVETARPGVELSSMTANRTIFGTNGDETSFSNAINQEKPESPVVRA